MQYEIKLTMRLESPRGQYRVVRGLESLFEHGTIKDSIAESLQLLNEPSFVAVTARRLSPASNSEAP
jgi:hypothetical protein